jgi:hypothetical protein
MSEVKDGAHVLVESNSTGVVSYDAERDAVHAELFKCMVDNPTRSLGAWIMYQEL